MNYYIGIDGGGTKTLFLCLNEKCEEVSKVELPTCHILQVSRDEAIQLLKEGVNKILSKIPTDSKVYICAGLAGYGNNQNLRKKVEDIASEAFSNIPYLLVNDARIALAGSLNNEDGILVIAGTGSIALSKSENKICRSGGWGYMIGDEGSAYWIGKKLLTEFSKQCDGRSIKTELVDVVKNYCGLNNEYDIISYVSEQLNNDRAEIAKLAKIAFNLVENGDLAVKRIFEEAGFEIANLINALAVDKNKIYHASYAGGVFNSGEIIINSIEIHLHNNIVLQRPYHEPVYGAVLLAKEHFDR